MSLQILMIIALGSTFLITDELLTRIGMKIGCKESNNFFNFLKKKKGENYAHFFVTVAGLSILVLIAVFFENALLLSLFAIGFAVPVVLNAFTIWRRLVTVVVIKRSSDT